MKRIVATIAVLVFAVSFAGAAELSPDRSHVKVSDVPRQCLETGSAETNVYKFTCAKVESAEVWNDFELRRFDKEIFEAHKQSQPVTTRVGLVVRQDTLVTRQEADYKNEVAVVEKRDGTKYRYTRK